MNFTTRNIGRGRQILRRAGKILRKQPEIQRYAFHGAYGDCAVGACQTAMHDLKYSRRDFCAAITAADRAAVRQHGVALTTYNDHKANTTVEVARLLEDAAS